MFLTRSERYEYRLYRRNRRRRKLALVLAVALVLTAVALDHHASAHPASRKGTSVTGTNAHARTPSARKSATAKASGLNWIDFHGIELPVSAQDGPHHGSGGLAWGFRDTTQGAVLAAVNIAVRTAAQWGPAIYQPTIHNQLTGPGASALLKTDASEYAGLRSAARVRPGQPVGRGYAVEVAYRVAAYAPAAAKVDILTEGPGNSGVTVMVVTRIDVVWLHGDWRVVAPADGDWASSATTASSMTGYTTFPDER